MTKAVEKYYSVAEISLLIGRHVQTIYDDIRAGSFGNDVSNLGSDKRPDYRVKASAVNAFMESRRVFLATEPGIAARSEGELRRKEVKAA